MVIKQTRMSVASYVARSEDMRNDYSFVVWKSKR